MGRIELANAIAAAARNAQQRGAHKEAAELYARALRVLAEEAPKAPVSNLWEQLRTHPPGKLAPGKLVDQRQEGGGWLRRYRREPK